jgi:hypothetical protein
LREYPLIISVLNVAYYNVKDMIGCMHVRNNRISVERSIP